MKNKSSHARRQARLNRLPLATQKLLKNRAAARQLVANAPLTRTLFSLGISPVPGMGLAEFDAVIAIYKDALGIAPLSDAEFEEALRISTPPECREVVQ